MRAVLLTWPDCACCRSPSPVTVKWGKDSFDVDVDPALPGAVFKTQMFTLTGVPPDRQKFTGIKNPPVKVFPLGAPPSAALPTR